MLEGLKEILEMCTEVDLSEISESTLLDRDLGIDSLGMAFLTIEIEKKFNITITSFPYLRTVGDLMEYIEKAIQEQNSRKS